MVETSLKQVCQREKEKCAKEREEVILGFHTILVEFYFEEFLWGFLPCVFLEENLFGHCVSMLVVLSVILLLNFF